MSLCSDDNQSSIEGLLGAIQPPVMIAQPTGNGGVFGGPRAEWIEQLHGNTQLANIESQSCKFQCKDHKDPYDIARCHDECNSNQQGSVQGVTRYASSIRIGDPQPVCSTDAWACFTGTGDESPAIRDVGIFGVFASGDCHHPLGCGY
ncbi:MAG: hypothetical protein ISN28_06200 [Ectothiorhodospiraceae bacterium AqS1]|nr:hypothetical protein [Ectothiorhodospiraceae bacterium AqS1]